MFRILGLIGGNLAQGPVTVRLPGREPEPAGLRGRVRIDPARCVACGVCAYVCVSDAIAGVEEEGAYRWTYEPGRCAFCARCVDICSGKALSMDPTSVPAYTTPEALVTAVTIDFPPCPRCGEPVRPAPEEWVRTAFATTTETTLELIRLCVRCRRRRLTRGMSPSPEGGA